MHFLLQLNLEQQNQSELSQFAQQQAELTQQVNELRHAYGAEKQIFNDLTQLISQEELLLEYRRQLSQGSGCPLCGATEHPKAGIHLDVPETQARKEQSEAKLSTLEKQGKEIKEQLQKIELQLSQGQNKHSTFVEKTSELKQQWQNLSNNLTITLQIEQQQELNQLESDWQVQAESLEQQIKRLQQADKEHQQTKDNLASLLATQAEMNSKLDVVSQKLNSQKQNLDDKQQHATALSEQLQQQRSSLQIDMQQHGQVLPETEIDQWLQQKRQDVEQYQQQQQKLQTLAQEISVTTERLSAIELQRDKAEKELIAQQTNESELKNTIEDLIKQRQQVFGEQTVEQARQSSVQQLQVAIETMESADKFKQDVEKEYIKLTSELTLTEDNHNASLKQYQALQADWHKQLEQSPFASQQEFENAILTPEHKQQLQELKASLETELETAPALSLQAEQHLQSLEQVEQAAVWSNTAKEVVAQQLAALESEREQVISANAQIAQKLQSDAEANQRHQALMQDIEQQQVVFDDLSYLHSLIGSASGDKFRRFAQGLTLDNLIYLANKQLDKLHGRYMLKRKEQDGLVLSVLDTWQGDVERNTKTLSGGESFLVSLALALALSDLVSHKTSIDSLFLDEGFGTLDSETLDIALDALDNLNASGKTIGVISHIEAMKERIPTQLKVFKKSGLGVSELSKEYRVN